MSRHHAIGATLCVALCVPWVASARPITLGEALAEAEQHPQMVGAEVAIEQAAGELAQARTFLYNPELAFAAGPAFGSDDAAYDLEVSLRQRFELGKRDRRARAAEAERAAAVAVRGATHDAVLAEVRRTFQLALLARVRVEVAREDELAALELAEAAAERLRLGGGTQTEVNVATALRGRGSAARRAAEAAEQAARLALGAAIGADPSDELEPSGELAPLAPPSVDEDEVVARAIGQRRDLVSLEQTRRARAADVEVEAVRSRPDPELAIIWERSALEGTDAILVGLSIELPVFNRNGGGTRAARAGLRGATIGLAQARAEVERETRGAYRRYVAAIEAVTSFDRDVVGTLHDNLELAKEARLAGKLDLLELNAIRRDLVESQQAYLDAQEEVIEARAELERALGAALEDVL